MTRRDGEWWLEGLPFDRDDPADTPPDRSNQSSGKWWLLTASAAAWFAFWIVALATDWDAKVVLAVLWVAGLPSIVDPFLEKRRQRRVNTKR